LSLTVRFATPADIDFVSQDCYLPLAAVRRKIDAQEVLIAIADRVPLGYARFEFIWSRVPYLTLIRVVPERRRGGVGKALLQFLESHLQRSGHAALWSSSTDAETEPQEWHLRMGFAPAGRLEGLNADGLAEVFFRKPLGT
jgi:GNAT superfamily N-acetyltransferase